MLRYLRELKRLDFRRSEFVATEKLINKLLIETAVKNNPDKLSKLTMFLDPDSTGMVSVDRFIKIFPKASGISQNVIETILRNVTLQSIPKARQVKGSGFNEYEEKKGISGLYAGEDKKDIFAFNFTENTMGYGDKKETKKNVRVNIRLHRQRSLAKSVAKSEPKMEVHFLSKPITKWGINFSGKVVVKIKMNGKGLSRTFDILIPGVKTYDPAGTRFQGVVTSAQIFSALHGGGNNAIQKIQESARPILEKYHGRSSLYEWMQHQINSVFIEEENPIPYPEFIMTYFVETGEIDLMDPKHQHTKRYMDSYFKGIPYPPVEYFAKLISKYQKCGEGPPPSEEEKCLIKEAATKAKGRDEPIGRYGYGKFGIIDDWSDVVEDLCGPDDADDPSKKQSKDIVYHELYTNAGELEKLKSAASDSNVDAGREALETEERKDKEQQTKDRLRGLKKKGLVFTAKDINFDRKVMQFKEC
mmetsp:Transcript_38705/g.62924  ORF Transcript_38705/g.62924 Transcript_38705/m.62924 type:complete len:473 (+) Transcript_38705:405-1823(+)